MCNRNLPALAAATASFGWMAPKLLLLCCAVRCAMPLARSCKFAFGKDSSARTCICTFGCLFLKLLRSKEDCALHHSQVFTRHAKLPS